MAVSKSVIINFNGLIFDRWGELIYEWDNIKDGWDGYINGTKAQNGVYIYKIRAQAECASKIGELIVGTVTLIK